MNNQSAEYWMEGALPGIINLLQPVAHALLQARREAEEMMKNFPNELLWKTPAGIASPAFHLQHITGVIDRLFTYADNKSLTLQQLNYLSEEGKYSDTIKVELLLQCLRKQIDNAIAFLKQTKPDTLTETRYIGRKKIATTQMGLLFHAAEHTMRHTGQLMITVKVIVSGTDRTR